MSPREGELSIEMTTGEINLAIEDHVKHPGFSPTTAFCRSGGGMKDCLDRKLMILVDIAQRTKALTVKSSCMF